jgi:microcystin-dependent protein
LGLALICQINPLKIKTMKKTTSLLSIILVLLSVFTVNTLFSQTGGMSINTDGSEPHSSAILDVKASDQGVLIPRMTSDQRSLIASPAAGLLVYQTNGTPGFYYFDGTVWVYLNPSSGGEAAPTGTIVAFAGDVVNIPFGWMLCNGAAINRTTYSNLYNAIGTAWGIGDGSTTFNLPDLRGQFLRGVNLGSGNDPDALARTAVNGGNSGDNVGSKQEDEFKSHNHSMQFNHWTSGVPNNYPTLSGYNSTVNNSVINGVSHRGGSETRPKNANVHYIIKY